MRPSTYTGRPFLRYLAQFSACFAHTTTRCHSVSSFFSPSLPVHFSVVAMRSSVTAEPDGVYRSSGSAPRLPIRIALFTLAIDYLRIFQRTHLKQNPQRREDRSCGVA